jgi:hypothetical protein
MEQTLETLNKDLYPWFFGKLEACDVIAIAHTSKYAYRAFLKYIADCLSRMGVSFNLLAHLYCDNTKPHLLEGIFRRMDNRTREVAWMLVYRSLAPDNMKVLLRWVDPNLYYNGALRFACERCAPDCLRVLLDDTRLLSYQDILHDIASRPFDHYGDVMRMLLRDERFQQPLHVAISYAFMYDMVAFKMMVCKDEALRLHHSLFMRSCSENKTEFIKIMIPYAGSEDLQSVLKCKLTKPVRELSNRTHV